MAWRPDYVTRAVLKNYLSIGDNADDVFIDLWITTVSRNIDDHTGRQFGKAEEPVDRFYTPRYLRTERAWLAQIDDWQDLTDLTVSAGGEPVTDYTLLPRNAAADGEPYTEIRLATCDEITMNGLPGWSAVPAAVSTGLLLQAARLAARRDSPFGIAGSPSEGSELRLLAQLDPDFRTSLKPLLRDWWAA